MRDIDLGEYLLEKKKFYENFVPPMQTYKEKVRLESQLKREHEKHLKGSVFDVTWNRIDHMHTCCGAKTSQRHKIKCPAANMGL